VRLKTAAIGPNKFRRRRTTPSRCEFFRTVISYDGVKKNKRDDRYDIVIIP